MHVADTAQRLLISIQFLNGNIQYFPAAAVF
jgi:hypothetical protein